MYLESLKIWNFRKYGESSDNGPGIEVHFHDGVNVLVGENDSGKTTIIDAIRYVLHTRSGEPIYLDEKDFFEDTKHQRAKSLRIECLFNGISSQDAAPFLEWLGFSKQENGKAFFVLRLVFTARRQEDGRIFSVNSQSFSFCAGVFCISSGFLSKSGRHFSFTHASAFLYSALS